MCQDANAKSCRSWGEGWLEPVPGFFQDRDAADTLELQKVTVEEEGVATATLVESESDSPGVEATD